MLKQSAKLSIVNYPLSILTRGGKAMAFPPSFIDELIARNQTSQCVFQRTRDKSGKCGILGKDYYLN